MSHLMPQNERPTYTQVCGPIRELLGVPSTEDFSIILWSSPEHPPEEGSFVLLRVLDFDGFTVVCEAAAYENGKFLPEMEGGVTRAADPRMVLGWSYYPYDTRAF